MASTQGKEPAGSPASLPTYTLCPPPPPAQLVASSLADRGSIGEGMRRLEAQVLMPPPTIRCLYPHL